MKLTPTISAAALAMILGWQAEAQIYDTNGAVVHTLAGSLQVRIFGLTKTP